MLGRPFPADPHVRRRPLRVLRTLSASLVRTKRSQYTERMNYGFFRAACASPAVTVADCVKNADAIIEQIQQAAQHGAALIVFPELSITGYTCGDLFLQRTLQRSAVAQLERIAAETAGCGALSLVGLPLAADDTLYNCAAYVYGGEVVAVVPKTFIPNYAEFYERRHFSPAPDANAPDAACTRTEGKTVCLSQRFPAVPFGTDILIRDVRNRDAVIAAEICEDVWVPAAPSQRHALSGATVIANLSASNEIIGKAEYRRMLVQSQSARLQCAYLYADAGNGESTTDMVFAAHNIAAENGSVLAESELFGTGLIFADFDLELLLQERRRTGTFAQCARDAGVGSYRSIYVDLPSRAEAEADELRYRRIDPHPFVPSGTRERTERCRRVVELQAEGLAKRLRHTNARTAVIGLSGGLDSTLALLVTAEAFRRCKLDPAGIEAVTMPCFGTTERTHRNAVRLSKRLHTSFREIPIAEAVRQHFADIGHDESVHDVTYENAQARERTQILMDVANKTGGLVIGTGDLSESALGWATYNGDHMSMYGVNSSVPKTLVRYLVAWFADEADSADAELAAVLRDILDTPVSPELLPPEDGAISQKTEELVGPYELHDFFLYYVLRRGFSPAKIYYLARKAFCSGGKASAEGVPDCETARAAGVYRPETVLKWLKIFYRRFFSQQFKRSCMPDGAKVGTVNLSPRGDWRMPSDASCALWQQELDNL